MESSALAHKGLENRAYTYLRSVRVGECSTSQCPYFPTRHGIKCWWVNKTQTILPNDPVLQSSWQHCNKPRVWHWALPTWKMYSFLPQGNLMKVTLNALNTSSELRHHLETMSWWRLRCWCIELRQDPGADMLLPALPQPRHFPHVDFGSGDSAVSGAGDCCASMFTVPGTGWEVVKIQKKGPYFPFLQYISPGFFNLYVFFSICLSSISFLVFALLRLHVSFPCFFPLLFHSDIRFCHYFCFQLVDSVLFHFHFFPIFSIVLS